MAGETEKLIEELLMMAANNMDYWDQGIAPLLEKAADYIKEQDRVKLSLRESLSRHEAVIRDFLDCPDIAENDYKDPETQAAERRARNILGMP